jgi:hypothetical protein
MSRQEGKVLRNRTCNPLAAISAANSLCPSTVGNVDARRLRRLTYQILDYSLGEGDTHTAADKRFNSRNSLQISEVIRRLQLNGGA